MDVSTALTRCFDTGVRLDPTSSSLTKKIDQMSSDMGNIMKDEELLDSLKRVTIGLGKLFDDIYP